ncbi:FecR family protein [Sphingobacterium paucimobilis]|uniref:FecR protein domain-containing protein n=1 Tax=Sphingobacterium paucimobilis HER1398 TaxID=1346330 RepID=U2J2K9_9SPHI|nr:FecR family protein [Sphingobacterium paucimobilis]ERJ59189.1 hypothetical protein M472_10435 [Sphingobacterium paucimobilis HER1398]
MERNRVTNLILKYKLSSLTDEELDELTSWLKEKPENVSAFSSICKDKEVLEAFNTFETAVAEDAWELVRKKVTKKNVFFRYYRYVAAVSIGLLLSFTGYYIWIADTGREVVEKNATKALDLFPAKAEARLITSDGEEHDLHAAAHINGFTSLEEGSLQYEEGATDVPPGINTLMTPEAAVYTMFLPDGTKAMLNASSSLEFPSKFASDSRVVKVTGEVYFEVKSDKNRPFVVQSDDLKIKVLGTKFNINAYEQNKRIALLEGKVQVENLENKKIMMPNDVIITRGEELFKSNKSIERELSWVDDLFYFEKDNLKHITTQLRRWYGVDVEIAPQVNQNVLYTGKISRQAMLTDVLDILNYLTNLKFKLNEKKITVTVN